MAMTLRSGRRYHPYRGRPKRSYRRAPPKRKFKSRGRAATSRYGKAISFGFKTHKTSTRHYRNALWKDTLFMTHYRSVSQGSTTAAIASIGTPGTSAVFLLPALSTGSISGPFMAPTSAFWTLNGGLQPVDSGSALPTFVGDITLRGGLSRMMFFNSEDIQMRIKVYAVWAIKNPSFTVYTALNNSGRGVDWDPSCVAEFSTEFGKIMYSKEAIVDPGQNFEVVHRFKPQKIDQVRFLGAAADPAGSQLWWMFVAACTTVNPGAGSIRIVNSWNLSFSADVVA